MPAKATTGAKPSAISKVAADKKSKTTKKAMHIAQLRQKSGADVEGLCKSLGWLPHTVRAALTGLRKSGFTIERGTEGAKTGRYRIVGEASK